ncbi:hypothetical protein TraAM80_04375 [Trypanosoma rangeli]|uniref:Uncharacterized protein n=1 Tax=Trypanosoma rangeli TaxID=5698 RepID=A0A422NJV8_TRYRA|nr:uncharacterized protein TraAM80_04375 [Trypanosoma rangeli]RNF05751.1 hypothetical protein TraAM80_04375 [Trypanosoma rangeli]|eukprot:RNF05751.1 hypothetical protein TraAM80_04375 [Trypanosoma rangeli]
MEKWQSLNRRCTLRGGGAASGADSPLPPFFHFGEKETVTNGVTSKRNFGSADPMQSGGAWCSPLSKALATASVLDKPTEGCYLHSSNNAKEDKNVCHKTPERRMKPARRRFRKPPMKLPSSNGEPRIQTAERSQSLRSDEASCPDSAYWLCHFHA